MKISPKKGETIKVYAGGKSGIIMSVADTDKNEVYASSPTDTDDVYSFEFKVSEGGEYYIYFKGNNANAYKVQLLSDRGSGGNTDTTVTESSSETTTSDEGGSSSSEDKTFNHVVGDINHDKLLTATDAALVIKSIVNSIFSFNNKNMILIADVNNDEKIDSSDTAMIIKKVLNSSIIFAKGENVIVSEDYYKK